MVRMKPVIGGKESLVGVLYASAIFKKGCTVMVMMVRGGDVVVWGGCFACDVVGWKISVALWVCSGMLCTNLKTSMLELKTG